MRSFAISRPGTAPDCGPKISWMDWTQTTYFPALRDLFLGLVRTAPERRDARAIEESRSKTAAALAIVDAHLEAHPFVAGNTFTAGDIPLGCGIWRWMALPVERPSLPNVERWYKSLQQRPTSRKMVMQPLS
jgi:glutathione S-transferase